MESSVLPNGLSGLPAAFQKLGLKEREFYPELSGLVVVIQGLPKDGKSTLAASIPNALYADCEGGAKLIVGKRCCEPIWVPVYKDIYLTPNMQAAETSCGPPISWESFKSALISTSKNEPGKYKTVVIDSLRAFQEMIRYDTEKSTNKPIDGFAWGDLNRKCAGEILEIRHMGFGVVLILHNFNVFEIVDRRMINYVKFGVTDGFLIEINGLADVILTIKRHINPAGKEIDGREIVTTSNFNLKKRRQISEGGRIELPNIPNIPLEGGWEELEKAYKKSLSDKISDSKKGKQ